MLLLVFVHGYNLEIRFLRPWSPVYEPLSITSFTEYFLANGLFRFRIPMLFAISGYLYALGDAAPNNQRFRKRLRTILLPYLIWSAIGLALTYGMETFTYTRNLIIGSKFFMTKNGTILLHDFTFLRLLRRWLLYPIPYQLWFLRVLVIYSLAYPVLRWCITQKYVRPVYFILVAVLWFISFDIAYVEGEGLLFFSLGIWMQKTRFNIEHAGTRFRPLKWGILFITLTVFKTWLAFKWPYFSETKLSFVLTVLHRLVVFSGLIACWFGLDGLVRWCMARPWFVWMSAFSFMIYVLHAPIVAFAINAFLSWLHPLPAYRLMTFVLLPLILIVFSFMIGILLRSLAPRSYSLLTGGRGL